MLTNSDKNTLKPNHTVDDNSNDKRSPDCNKMDPDIQETEANKSQHSGIEENSLEIDIMVTEVSETKEKSDETQEFEEIKDEVENVFDSRVSELSAKEEGKEDYSSVYMSSLLTIFTSLNDKIESIYTRKNTEKELFKEIKKNLILQDSNKAMEIINLQLGETEVEQSEIYKDFIRIKIKNSLLGIRTQLLATEEIVFNLRNEHKRMQGKLLETLDKNVRFYDIIQEQDRKFRAQTDVLISENEILKNGIVKTISQLDPAFVSKSQIGEDVLSDVKELIQRKNEVLSDLRQEIMNKDKLIEDYESKAKDFDILHLTSQVKGLKLTQKKLQDENINLTQIISKITEKSNKLKIEANTLSSELKTAQNTISKRNETISRQKSLIEMFQDKLSGVKTEFPIEQLKHQKRILESKLEKEGEYFKKQNIKKEIADCERRLRDFEAASRNLR